MFDRTINEILSGTITVFVTNREAQFVGEFAIIDPGYNVLTYQQTLELQRLIKKHYSTLPKRQISAVRSFHNSLTMAWGPEVNLDFII